MDEVEPASNSYRAFVGWLQGKLHDPTGDREAVLDRIEAQMARAYSEGIEDAIRVALDVRKAAPASREMAILVDALVELRDRAK